MPQTLRLRPIGFIDHLDCSRRNHHSDWLLSRPGQHQLNAIVQFDVAGVLFKFLDSVFNRHFINSVTLPHTAKRLVWASLH
ncbi:MAG: hypothetical protein V7641_5014 [Blastocatellia bacterium]